MPQNLKKSDSIVFIEVPDELVKKLRGVTGNKNGNGLEDAANVVMQIGLDVLKHRKLGYDRVAIYSKNPDSGYSKSIDLHVTTPYD